jgi:3-hydroxyacyl-CoA dehydrogenase/enoyl-CoA hydratase/3-hydroxybutyryl-CoA epimerase/enoyl-CoA isomerase
VKRPTPDAHELLAAIQPAGPYTFAAEEIVDRLMLPMIVEAALCLEEGVAQSAADIDMSLVLGLGFPRHWGGALKYADLVGLPRVIARCGRYAHLGAAYQPTATMRERARSGTKYF